MSKSSELPKSYRPELVEDKWYEYWLKHNLFRSEVNRDKQPFSIVIPPPNVTGALHIGHAYNNAVQDIYIRFKRMQGFEVLWSPGTDHAGIATQTVVEKQLGEASVTINPKDAASRDLTEGQTVILHNKIGKLTLKLALDNDIPIGVALSHKGRWPKRQPDGANVNVLNPGLKSDMGESTSVHGVEVEISAAG